MPLVTIRTVLDALCFRVLRACLPKICERGNFSCTGDKDNWLDFEVKGQGHEQTKCSQKRRKRTHQRLPIEFSVLCSVAIYISIS